MTADQFPPEVRQLLASTQSSLARLNQHLQSLIPTFIEEFGTSNDPGISGTEVFNLKPERDTLFRVTGIFVSLPLNTVSAELQLGNQFTLPLQNTTTLLTPLQRILESTDVRRLTYTTGSANGGAAFLWLFGDAVPSYGAL
jgi:hypothetical protein